MYNDYLKIDKERYRDLKCSFLLQRIKCENIIYKAIGINCNVFLAVGIIRLSFEKESYIFLDKDLKNITSSYFDGKYRLKKNRSIVNDFKNVISKYNDDFRLFAKIAYEWKCIFSDELFFSMEDNYELYKEICDSEEDEIWFLHGILKALYLKNVKSEAEIKQYLYILYNKSIDELESWYDEEILGYDETYDKIEEMLPKDIRMPDENEIFELPDE